MDKRFFATGHLIDTGILTQILNIIVDEGGSFEVERDMGRPIKTTQLSRFSLLLIPESFWTQ